MRCQHGTPDLDCLNIAVGPLCATHGEERPTLRDMFAMHVVSVLITKDGWRPNKESVASEAYEIADAMLRARNPAKDYL